MEPAKSLRNLSLPFFSCYDSGKGKTADGSSLKKAKKAHEEVLFVASHIVPNPIPPAGAAVRQATCRSTRLQTSDALDSWFRFRATSCDTLLSWKLAGGLKGFSPLKKARQLSTSSDCWNEGLKEVLFKVIKS